MKATHLVCEFTGTFIATFVIACNILSQATLAWAPVGVAMLIMMLVAAFTYVCEAHLNPAVSMAAGLAGKVAWIDVLGYVIAQVCGAMSGSWCAGSLYWPMEVQLSPGVNFSWYEAMIVETLFTAFLSFVVLNTWHSEKNNYMFDPNQFYPLAIGFVYIAGGYSCAPVSGAQFNPAVSVALASSCRDNTYYWGFIYASFQVMGGFIGTVLYKLVRHEVEDIVSNEREIVLPTKLACEFIGTFMLTVTVALNCLAGSPATPLAAGSALMSMVYSVGDISGANLNPAVTLSLLLSGRGGLDFQTGMCYMFFQLGAGVIAVLLAEGIYAGATYDMNPKDPFNGFSASCLEAMFTGVLCLTVLCTATMVGVASKMSRNFYFGLAIGMAVTAGGFAAGPASGGWLNPAVAFGSAVGGTLEHRPLRQMWRYVMGEFAGAGMAVLVFQLTQRKECKRQKFT